MIKLSRRRIVITLVAICSLVTAALALSAPQVGITSETGNGGLALSITDISAVPHSVVSDAEMIAAGLFEDHQEECDRFANELLATYLKAKDKDFVVVFNPGGWGWNLVEASPGWQSIFNGIQAELSDSNYTSLLLTYSRTVNTLLGRLEELEAMITDYSLKARELACMVDFLTAHNTNLRVIIAGESHGTVISDRAMSLLADNQRVYSIQSGPPFWHRNEMTERTLVMKSNGIVPDSFSQGNFWELCWGNLKYWLNLSQPEENYGTTPHYVRAPGHDYWWQYPEVYSQITEFLQEKFGFKFTSP